MIYFFGKRGTGELRFKDFHTFMDNLQTEVLQMEFNEFAKVTNAKIDVIVSSPQQAENTNNISFFRGPKP